MTLPPCSDPLEAITLLFSLSNAVGLVASFDVRIGIWLRQGLGLLVLRVFRRTRRAGSAHSRRDSEPGENPGL